MRRASPRQLDLDVALQEPNGIGRIVRQIGGVDRQPKCQLEQPVLLVQELVEQHHVTQLLAQQRQRVEQPAVAGPDVQRQDWGLEPAC